MSKHLCEESGLLNVSTSPPQISEVTNILGQSCSGFRLFVFPNYSRSLVLFCSTIPKWIFDPLVIAGLFILHLCVMEELFLGLQGD
jgi:hypothetical protein